MGFCLDDRVSCIFGESDFPLTSLIFNDFKLLEVLIPVLPISWRTLFISLSKDKISLSCSLSVSKIPEGIKISVSKSVLLFFSFAFLFLLIYFLYSPLKYFIFSSSVSPTNKSVIGLIPPLA